ncbi:hypothetical protein HAX54_037596 [Datura stramonium]|uniref:Uncharacterized protein n=1 Tax=Datura stramonium TaxID=4076 RepID=A0ABS8SHG6_DATST|nr:hypothetical protein [Datura stramonium]
MVVAEEWQPSTSFLQEQWFQLHATSFSNFQTMNINDFDQGWKENHIQRPEILKPSCRKNYCCQLTDESRRFYEYMSCFHFIISAWTYIVL